MHMESTSLGVRKGYWTGEEDMLLRKCIGKYGEGKWHLIPERAGLNRCRKSCRLRWLNYLKPNIKKGSFTSDEVDLIIRLHKLLGNRWSLIAGRIPGRTANDVKNYWNNHLRIKHVAREEVTITKAHQTTETKVIRPQPRRFSNNLACFRRNTTIVHINNINQSEGSSINLTNPSPLTSPLKVDDDILWWDNMVELDMELIESMGGSDKDVITSLWTDEVATGVDIASDSSVQDGKNIGLDDFTVDDVDLWDLL